MTYPDGTLQKFFNDNSWWDERTDKILTPGRLIWAFIPHVDIMPKSMIQAGRLEDEAGNHNKINYEIADLRIRNSYNPMKNLPTAILPYFREECYTVHRSKKRPALVLGDGGPEIPKELRSSMKPSWHVKPTITVAPYYGAEKKGQNKWYEPFVERIKKCEYPQYIWDILPIQSETKTSILRLDHIQPIGKHYNSYELTDYVLQPEVMDLLVNEWLPWLFTGVMEVCETEGCKKTYLLNEIRDELLSDLSV
ncbi:MAG: hypothetical protein Q3M30_13525 [Candidatus Electrothrix sp. Rat3]|nr:hypothetical protein [Candidatus Electrothrix rattekaaiensis]